REHWSRLTRKTAPSLRWWVVLISVKATLIAPSRAPANRAQASNLSFTQQHWRTALLRRRSLMTHPSLLNNQQPALPGDPKMMTEDFLAPFGCARRYIAHAIWFLFAYCVALGWIKHSTASNASVLIKV